MDRIQGQMEQLIRENERLRQEVRRSGDERMTGAQTTSIGSHRSDPSFDIQKRQIQLLEEQKEYLENLYQESEDTINRLQAEINDLKHPLQPHLMKLDMETKLVSKFFVEFLKRFALIFLNRFKKIMLVSKVN